MKHGRCLGLSLSIALLSSCSLGLSSAWTGVSLIYDRHNIYKKVDDFQLVAEARRALYRDYVFKRDDCSLDIAALNGDVLIAGHVVTEALRDEAYKRVASLGHYRRLFNQIAVGRVVDNVAEDSWITAKIRSQIVADSRLDPNQFKVITSARVVYLMGDVEANAASRVIQIARETEGVLRVVKLLKYYHLTDEP